VRRTPTGEVVLSVLYIAGVSANKFSDALRAVLGDEAKELSPSIITRLTVKWQAEYNAWKKRDLTGREYIYVWADEIYIKSRLNGEKTCLLVIIGINIEGKKELVAVQSGIRVSKFRDKTNVKLNFLLGFPTQITVVQINHSLT
jgi:putative transposase